MRLTSLISTGVVSLLAALATSAHPQRYTVTDLGTLPGSSFSQATFVNNFGLVTGISTLTDGTQHAVVWYRGSIFDIATHFPAGTNSGAFAANDWGQILIQAETGSQDPDDENFCSYFTGRSCRALLWQGGFVTQLPTLGGTNSAPSMINNRGQIVGMAENRTRDASCPAQPAVTGSGPQTLDFESVLWGPWPDEIRELHPLSEDTVGMAFWINDLGQVVGGSGSCDSSILPGPAVTPHAVLWENGKVTDMGSLGGTVNTSVPGIGTIALSINNRGQAVGAAALPGDKTGHAFLWSKELGHMLDLGTILGDITSAALGINDEGNVVGPSFDASGSPRAFLFSKGTMKDLNALVPPDSPIYMLIPYAINGSGQIVGFGVTGAGEIHGFLARPCARDREVSAECGREEASASAEHPRPPMSDETREWVRRSVRAGALGRFIPPR